MLLPDQTYEQACQQQNTNQFNTKKFPTKSKYIIDERKYESKSESETETESDTDDTDSDTSSDDDFEENKEKCDDLPENFSKTTEFFNNIPEFHGEPLGPFSIPIIKNDKKLSESHQKTPPSTSLPPKHNDILRECETFLFKYRIKPDFFCRYRHAME